MRVRGNNTGEEYALAGSYLGVTAAATINGSAVALTTVNSTAVRLALTGSTLPTSSNPVLRVILTNIISPPFVSQLYLTIYAHHSSGGVKETLTTSTYTTTALSLTAASLSAYLLANNTLTITLTNSNRNILTKNASPSTTLVVALPSVVSCASVSSGSLSVVWMAGVSTSGTLYSGNTTHLTISLGQCYVDYFPSSASFTLT